MITGLYANPPPFQRHNRVPTFLLLLSLCWSTINSSLVSDLDIGEWNGRNKGKYVRPTIILIASSTPLIQRKISLPTRESRQLHLADDPLCNYEKGSERDHSGPTYGEVS